MPCHDMALRYVVLHYVYVTSLSGLTLGFQKSEIDNKKMGVPTGWLASLVATFLWRVMTGKVLRPMMWSICWGTKQEGGARGAKGGGVCWGGQPTCLHNALFGTAIVNEGV